MSMNFHIALVSSGFMLALVLVLIAEPLQGLISKLCDKIKSSGKDEQ